MSAGHQQPASTWTEPPWSGWIETTGDALLILEAARRGLIPRVTRRLVDSERKMITSGSVFVFDEDESGIKRWTDGFFWSPSRILGNFLLYRETDKRGTGHRGGRAQDGGSPDNESPQSPEATRQDTQSLSRPKMDGTHLGLDKLRERSLMGSLTNSYKFKSDGLMKKTFSLNIGGVAQHLISYYRIEDVENGRLRSPSSLPELASLDISPEYLDKTHFRNPPKVEVGPDGIPRYRGEADDVETSTSLITAPLSSGLPLLTDGRVTEGSKRAKRFDPYGAPSSMKRSRKHGKTTPEASGSSDQLPAQQTTSASPTAIMQPPQVYPDPNAPHPQHSQPYPPYGGYYPMPGYGMPPPPPPHAYSPPYPAPAPPPTSGSPVPTPTAPAPVAGPSQPQTHPHPPPQHPSPPIGTPPVPAGAPMPIPYPYPGYPNPGVPPGASDSAAPAPPYYGYYHAPPGAYYPPWAAAPPYGPAYAHPHAPPQPPMPAGVIEGVGAEKSGQEGEGNGEEEES